MEIASLKTFIEVVRRGSFSAVAHDHNVSPSSVSRVVAKLESELGTRLFQRSTRRLEPTEAGNYYFEHIEHLIEKLEQAGQGCIGLNEVPQGTLRITAPVAFGQLVLAPLLPAFSKIYPQLEFELLFTDKLLDLLAERVDLAIRLGTLEDSASVATRIFDEEFVICASSGYLKQHGNPHIPTEITKHECLHFPMSNFAHWHFLDKRGDTNTVSVRSRWRMTNSVTLKTFAQSGMGLTFLPRWAVWQELRTGELIQLFTNYKVTAANLDTAAWLLYPSRSYLPLKVRVLIDFLKEKLRNEMTMHN
ncbi:MAG: LysR family transcriptional regulator [Gammaproteobacteria bacterium]|nr:LysR family transcriptional regulator [Gammaproteobacteria bacterium]